MNRIRLSLITLGVIGTSLSAAWFNGDVEVLAEYPLPLNERSVDNGGTKTLTEASGDGIGVIIDNAEIGNSNKVDNSAFNTLLYKYGKEAEISGLSLADYVINEYNNGNPKITRVDYNFANEIKNNIEKSALIAIDGTPCDDGNPNTYNDVFKNKICYGEMYFSFNDLFESGNCYDGGTKSLTDKTIHGYRVTGDGKKGCYSIPLSNFINLDKNKLYFEHDGDEGGALYIGDDRNLDGTWNSYERYSYYREFKNVRCKIEIDLVEKTINTFDCPWRDNNGADYRFVHFNIPIEHLVIGVNAFQAQEREHTFYTLPSEFIFN